MNETAMSLHDQHIERDRALRHRAVLVLALLFPTVIACLLFVGVSERASRCVTYGEECFSVPGTWMYTCFFVSLAAGVVAVIWPRAWLPCRTARAWAVGVQIAAQAVLALLILSFA
ncbi:hypothetical protein [Streptomyces sp. GbtcB7]|uniref:hypothetical protein n=1 Tax=Streptomyces sp. GbtcB7 TaxID=2824752 RepID=UPI001C2F205E|nr:hypothetical protein [Streptomyces sp. GbtcB7]